MKNTHHIFPEPTVTPSNYFFCPINNPKPKDFSCTAMNDKESRSSYLKLHWKRLRQLIDYQNSWRLLFFQSSSRQTRLPSKSGIQSKRSNVRSRATLSIEAVLQHQAKCSHFLCVGEPGAVQHPGWIGRALSTYHQKHWTARPVEGFIYKVPLRGKKGGESVRVNKSCRQVCISGLVCISMHVVFRMSQEG